MNPVHLIIAGTTKAGTTSLFQYLGDHPQVCPSSMKETRFFLDKDYPLESKYRYENEIEKYYEFLKHRKSETILMEATPDYLYSKATAQKIKESIPSVELVFILREPTSRFISWFKFSKQIGKLPPEASLANYFDMQLNSESHAKEQYMMALEQGNYSFYLANFYKCFPPQNIYIGFFEELKREPLLFIQKLCSFLALDASFYNSYDFEKHNETVDINNPAVHKKYIELSFRIRKIIHDKKMIRSAAKKIKNVVYPLYMKLNSRKVQSERMSKEVLERLDSYYSIEREYFQDRYSKIANHE